MQKNMSDHAQGGSSGTSKWKYVASF